MNKIFYLLDRKVVDELGEAIRGGKKMETITTTEVKMKIGYKEFIEALKSIGLEFSGKKSLTGIGFEDDGSNIFITIRTVPEGGMYKF